MHLAAGALHAGQAVQRLAQARAQHVAVAAALVEQRAHGAALLVEQREQQVDGLDQLVIAAQGERLRVLQGSREFGREFVLAHAEALSVGT